MIGASRFWAVDFIVEGIAREKRNGESIGEGEGGKATLKTRAVTSILGTHAGSAPWLRRS